MGVHPFWVGRNDRDWMVPESTVHEQSWVAIGLEHLSRMVVFPRKSGGTADLNNINSWLWSPSI